MNDSDRLGLLAEETASYTLTVNARDEEVPAAWIGESLLFVLRERLGLPGSKSACEQGECGSCCVLMDGALVCSCMVMAADAVDAEIVTIEGLSDGDGELSDVQQHFVKAGAIQCGFCTPGLVMAVEALLADTPEPTDLQIREALSGNLCRCTGYGRIIEAARQAAEGRRHGS